MTAYSALVIEAATLAASTSYTRVAWLGALRLLDPRPNRDELLSTVRAMSDMGQHPVLAARDLLAAVDDYKPPPEGGTVPATSKQLDKSLGTCDACGVQALKAFRHTSTGQTLEFCGHHAHANELALIAAGWVDAETYEARPADSASARFQELLLANGAQLREGD